MNKKFMVSAFVVGFASLILGFVVHSVLLNGAYAKLPDLYRAETAAQSYFGYMLLAHLLIGTGLTWVYRKGHESGKPFAMQGVKFAAAIFVLMTLPTYLIYPEVRGKPRPSGRGWIARTAKPSYRQQHQGAVR